MVYNKNYSYNKGVVYKYLFIDLKRVYILVIHQGGIR